MKFRGPYKDFQIQKVLLKQTSMNIHAEVYPVLYQTRPFRAGSNESRAGVQIVATGTRIIVAMKMKQDICRALILKKMRRSILCFGPNDENELGTVKVPCFSGTHTHS